MQNETEKTLNSIKAGIMARQSVMLVGDPGKGKSAVVHMLAEEMGYDVITIIGSQRDATDITGFPHIETVNLDGNSYEVQSYAVPNWQFRIMKEKKIFLFLDEFSNSNPAVQASMLCLLNEREFANGDKLPEETVIIGAMNPVSSAANGFELTPPTCNRLMFIPWEPSDASWLEGLVSNWGHPERISAQELKWRRIIAKFLMNNSMLIYKMPSDKEKTIKPIGIADSETAKLDIVSKAYPSNRSWTNLAKTIPYCRNSEGKISNRIIEEVAFGMVGMEATIRFMDYIKENYSGGSQNNVKLPSLEEALATPSCVDWRKINQSQSMQFFSNLIHSAEQNNAIIPSCVNLFVHIAESRGTDLCAPYVEQLTRIASLNHMVDENRKLINAYKTAFSK